MPKSHAPYPPEFRRQMVELVRAGRTPEELSREFGALGRSDSHLGAPGGSRRRSTRRRSHDRGAGGTAAPAPGKQAAAHRA